MIKPRSKEDLPIQKNILLNPVFKSSTASQKFSHSRFSVVEMKRIYRGFKTECPTGLITEEAFHGIYSRFFPQGGTGDF